MNNRHNTPDTPISSRMTFAEDADGWPAVGFVHQDIFISDPFASDCGRFAVDPAIAYGMSMALAQAIVHANGQLRAHAPAALPEFVGLWGEGYTPQGAPVAQAAIDASHGYSPADIAAIAALRVRCAWQADDLNEHIIIRIH